MNKLLQVPQHHLPTDAPSGCFSDLLRCLLCGGTVSTRSSIASPTPHYSTYVSKKFGELLQNDDQVQVGNLLPDRQGQREAQVPIVARLMGLETPVDMSWKPTAVDGSFDMRSRSVNYVDYLFHSSPESGPGLLHRRVKTSLSFGELPAGDFLVVCLESAKSNAQCDQRRVKDAQKGRSGSKPEHGKDKGRALREGKSASRTTNACIKCESRRHSEQTRNLSARIKSSQGITTNVEQTDQLKMGTKSCLRTANRRTAKSTWQQKNDYYRKPAALKSKETQKDLCISSKSKSKKQQKDVNPPSKLASLESSVSGRSCSGATRRIKTRSSRDVRLRAEERRSSRKSNNNNLSTETFGEGMMKNIKYVIEQDLEMEKWKWDDEAGFSYREYLSMVIELGIMDELVNQTVHDFASSCDV